MTSGEEWNEAMGGDGERRIRRPRGVRPTGATDAMNDLDPKPL
jgi:hypothetical protein